MSGDFEALSGAIVAAAGEFGQGAAAPLLDLVALVERAAAEKLEIFPVCHHSPASGAHLIGRLRARPPRVLFVEMCEDLIAAVPELVECSLPIALQAFGAKADAFEGLSPPLSVIGPLTEISAEYQAIAFASSHPETELVFVDRSVDHYFQWLALEEEDDDEHEPALDDQDDDEGRAVHGGARALEMGTLKPTFADFADFLLVNAQVAHFSEWWSAYVEEPALAADYETYRRVMFLVGSLIRQLGTTDARRKSDELRERYMWTRMKEWLAANKVAASDALYICGAAHAASDVPEFGTLTSAVWEIPPRTETPWLYGLIPSSYSAIEAQFSHPRGTISQAIERWAKAKSAMGFVPFTLTKPGKKTAKAKATKRKSVVTEEASARGEGLLSFLTTPPAPVEEDRDQLLSWSTGIVDLARKNGYLASTADSIAIYENAVLLANLRARAHPSAYDFTDAAVTCLEKAAVPGKRSVFRLCQILLGADKVGQVGYDSLPPLVKDIYDRLASVGVNAKKKTITRALFDFAKDPSRRPTSDLLWRLNYLCPDSRVARPIMGERTLGGEAMQESWDILVAGAEQREVIQLAYEGITVEQVLEKRIRESARGAGATALGALEAVRASELLLDNRGLSADLGARAVALLLTQTGADDAHAIFDIVRELIHYYRTTPHGLPSWLEDFVATGYQHYASLLPESFGDRGTAPEKVAGMLAFIFTLESLALTLGCSRSQLVIAIESAAPLAVFPEKKGLLWAAEWLIQRRTAAEVRAEFDAVVSNPMSVGAFPGYLAGFLLALEFSSQIAPVGVELLSRAFAELPDSVLMPWLPGLLDTLRGRAGQVMPSLLKEAAASLPRKLAPLDAWTPPWKQSAAAAPTSAPTSIPRETSSGDAALTALLFSNRAATDAHAASLGLSAEWGAAQLNEPAAGPTPSSPPKLSGDVGTTAILQRFGLTAAALAALLATP